MLLYHRPHPLGHVTHPAWQSVRDRYNELQCNAIMNERPENEKAKAFWSGFGSVLSEVAKPRTLIILAVLAAVLWVGVFR